VQSDRFEWDDAKAAATLRERGLAFSYAATLFDDPARREVLDDRRAYGEVRIRVIGRACDGLLLSVVFTRRGERIRLISVRRAKRRERVFYEQTHKE
jgi:uncharacterized DUF497 family protein